jgi:ectoine hydroxylase-related dioxygenase (phytanoyl-CoA dioxygenase family)
LADILAIVREDGGVVIEDFITQAQVEALNAEIGPHLDSVVAGGTKGSEFHGAQTRRLTRLPALSRTFREQVLDIDLLHDLADAVFLEESGSYWLTTAQLIEIGPGNKPQPLHRDLENNPPFVPLGRAAPEVMVNFLVALSDFTDENGGTRIIPGSHTWSDYADRGTQEMTVPVEMKAGDAVFFTGKVVHGGGANRTEDEFRRGIAIPIQPSYLTPEEPFPFVLDVGTVRHLPQRVQAILGFRTQHPNGAPGGLWFINSGELADYLGL